MKNRYTQYIGQLQGLIDLEYPGQKLYPGIIQDIYKLTKLIERGENINNISFFIYNHLPFLILMFICVIN